MFLTPDTADQLRPARDLGSGVEGMASRRDLHYPCAVHEMGIALEIYRVCRDAVRAHPGGRIEKVRLAVGELAAVEPDLVEFAWQAVIDGGPDAGACLEITWCPAIQHCPTCDEPKERADGTWLRLCIDCGQPLRVEGGTELDVLEIELITDDEELET